MNAGANGAPPLTWAEVSDLSGSAEFREGPLAGLDRSALEHALIRRLAAVDMAEGIAHDVKNQLTVVVAAVQMVGQRVPPEQAELLRRARNCAMRAAELMDELVRFARDAATVSESVDAAAALETAVAGSWGYCGARGVRLELRVPAALPQVAAPGAELRLLLLHAIRWLAGESPANARLIVEGAPAGNGVAVRFHVEVEGATLPVCANWPEALRRLVGGSGVRFGAEDGMPTLYLAPEPDGLWKGYDRSSSEVSDRPTAAEDPD